MARNIDRKELKAPDQFVSFWTRAASFVSQRRRVVIGAAVAAVVAVVGMWAVSSLMAKRHAAASRAFIRIEQVATAELLPASGQPAKPYEDGLPHFKTEKERVEGAIKEADAFLAAHGGSALADEARLIKAKYLLALGNAPEALNIYRALVGGNLDKRLRFLAQEGLGYALEASGQLDQAAAAFGALADEAGNAGGFYKDRALFHKARLLERKGSGKDAEKIFREILDKTPTTSLRQEITDRLASLEDAAQSKSPSPSAPPAPAGGSGK